RSADVDRFRIAAGGLEDDIRGAENLINNRARRNVVDVIHAAIRADAGEEILVGGAVQIQPGEMVGRLAIDDIEIAPHQDLPVKLLSQRAHPAVGAGMRIKIQIHAARKFVKPGNPILSQDAADGGEISAQNHRPKLRRVNLSKVIESGVQILATFIDHNRDDVIWPADGETKGNRHAACADNVA